MTLLRSEILAAWLPSFRGAILEQASEDEVRKAR